METKIDTSDLVLNPSQQHSLDKKVSKLKRLCQLFKPDLVLTHARISIPNPRQGYFVKLNLEVPHRIFSANSANKKFSIAVGQAFSKVMSQLRKYRSKLRREESYSEVASKIKGK